MPDGIGLRIGVEGEKEFKDAIKDINQSMKVLGSEMQLVSSEFDKNDKSVQAVTARNTVLNKEIDQQRDRISTLKDALANSAETYGENDKRTQAWQIQLNKAQAELNGMEHELEQNNSALEESAGGFDDAGQEAKKFGEDVKKTGSDANDAGGKFEKLGDVLKTVGVALGAAMAAIGTGAVAAGKQLYDMATATAASGDHIDKMSQKLGLSKEGFQEWDYILSQNGASIDSLGSGMKTLTKTLSGVTEDGDKASEAFAAIGISFDNIKDRSPEEAFNMTIRALQDMPEGADKTAAAMKLLGKQGMELAPLLNSTSDATDALRKKSHDLGMILSDEGVQAAANFTDSMDNLTRAFSGAKDNIGAALLPGMTQVTNGLAELIAGNAEAGESIRAGAEEVANSISEILPNIVNTFSTIADVIVVVAPGIITSLIDGITENLPMLMDGALSIILSLLDAIVANLPQLADAAVQMIAILASGLGSALPKLIPAAIQAVLQIVKGLIDNLPLLLKAALDLMLGLAKGLIDAIPELVKELPAIIRGIVDFLIAAIPMIVETGIQLLMALVENLPAIIDGIVAALPEIIDAVITALITLIPMLVEAGIQLFIALVQALPVIIAAILEAIPKIVTAVLNAITTRIPEMVAKGKEMFESLVKKIPEVLVTIRKALDDIGNSIKTYFSNMINTMKTAGADLIEGLWNGIQDMQQWIIDKIGGFVDSVVSKMKSFFGIASESKVLHEMGTHLPEGLANGMDENAYMVTDSGEVMLASTMKKCQEQIGEFEDFVGREIPVQVSSGIRKNASKAEKEAEAMNKKLLAAQKKAEKERYDSSILFIGEYRLAEDYSAYAEMEMWKTLLVQYEGDQKKRVKIKEEMVKLEKAADKVYFEETKRELEAEVKNRQLSSAQVIEIWMSEREMYAENSEYRIKADQEFLKARETVMKEQEALFKTQEKLVADMEKAEEKYIKAVEARAQAIYNSFGLFDELKQREEVSTDVLTKNLQDQVTELQNWSENLELLAKKGIDEGLLEELRGMGVKANPEIKALVSMSDAELDNYTKMWKDKHAIARAAAVKELEGLRKETDEELKKLQAQLQDTFDKSVIPALKKSGEGMADGVIEGFEGKETELINKVSAIMGRVVAKVNQDMDIRSPSGIFKRIGSFLAQGLGVGFESEMDSLARSMVNAVPTNFPVPGVAGGSGAVGMSQGAFGGLAAAGGGNTFILQVKMDEVNEVYKLKQIFENFAHNRIVYQGV